MERVIVIAVFICMMMTALLIAHAVVFTVVCARSRAFLCADTVSCSGISRRMAGGFLFRQKL